MGEYRIQPGDTLSKIAKMTGTTVKQLQELNGIKNANLIFAGTTIKIPDVASDDAFNLKGWTVEKQQLPQGEVRLMYGVPCNPSDKKDGVPGETQGPGSGDEGSWWNPIGGIKHRLLYGVPCNPGDKDLPSDIVTPEEGDSPEIRPVYSVPYKPEDGDKDVPIKPPVVKVPVPGQGDKDDDVVPIPGQDGDNVMIRATAKDMELLERLGASKTSNDPNGKAQFVLGDEIEEVYVEGDDKTKPETITIRDDTNGDFNKYTYRLISDNEIADGKTRDGIPLNKSQFEEGKGPYYVLISSEDHNGTNLKNSHTEVYRLEYTERDDGSRSYDLIQDKGMDGSNRSSMDYRRR